MRQKKYRGWSSKDNKWVYGGIHQLDLDVTVGHYIVTNEFEFSSVYHESAGEFTGLKDKNGICIYEGDCLRRHHDDGESNYEGIVSWIAEGDWLGWCVMLNGHPNMLLVDSQDSLEVIGNTYENPALKCDLAA